MTIIKRTIEKFIACSKFTQNLPEAWSEAKSIFASCFSRWRCPDLDPNYGLFRFFCRGRVLCHNSLLNAWWENWIRIVLISVCLPRLNHCTLLWIILIRLRLSFHLIIVLQSVHLLIVEFLEFLLLIFTDLASNVLSLSLWVKLTVFKLVIRDKC